MARGVVYVLVGILALEIALGNGGGQQADRQGALHQVAAQPFGRVMLWLLVVGFACMTVWRASLAVFGEGGRKKTGSRVLSAGRAVFYATVCWGTASYAAGGGQSGSNDKSQDWTSSALQLPGGRVLVGIAGVVMLGIGVGIVVSAVQRKFLKKLESGKMSRRARKVVTVLGLGGNTARGTVFAGAGVFVLVAAIRFDPHQAKGMDATLRSFAHTPAGPWLLVLIALGLVLFGAFSFASARWRRL
nr:DUF1206 domain-containing protein [Streptomyces tateyamensis]